MDTVVILKTCTRLVVQTGALPIARAVNLRIRPLNRWKHVQKVEGKPVKFTTSQANLDYRATDNFYSDDQSLPKSHNLVLASSGVFGIVYLFLLRDNKDYDGESSLFAPVHETVPELAIPMLKSAIAQNKKFGYDTSKLEKKLAEYMREPEKYGQRPTRLVEN